MYEVVIGGNQWRIEDNSIKERLKIRDKKKVKNVLCISKTAMNTR
ncbi:hypothetical protein E2C01_043067 [Portunus trituberculatus]|uniref:Uncharacterized protein n=1 Tax=Portunus trituberculatus TaxID=210409 RepID=A0A5B7FNG7_PORTR|nr:hypothetical protein [Portunus trituberculatus]